jgi:hypothetical protein
MYWIWKILFVPFVLDMSLCVRTFSAERCLDVSWNGIEELWVTANSMLGEFV